MQNEKFSIQCSSLLNPIPRDECTCIVSVQDILQYISNKSYKALEKKKKFLRECNMKNFVKEIWQYYNTSDVSFHGNDVLQVKINRYPKVELFISKVHRSSKKKFESMILIPRENRCCPAINSPIPKP